MQKLIERGYQIKQQLEVLKTELTQINVEVAKNAQFQNGKKTGHITTGTINAKVVLRETIKWDQEKLSKISEHFDNFSQFIKTEIKPVMAAINKAPSKDLQKAFAWCKEVKPATPAVTYELIEEEIPF